METNIVVPPMHSLTLTSADSFSAWWVVDGISVLCGPKNKNQRRFAVKPAMEERELRILSESAVEWHIEPTNLRESPDKTPVDIPVNLRGEPSLGDQIRELISRELSRRAKASGRESFEEADDFNVSEQDLDDMLSPYELKEMEDEEPAERRALPGSKQEGKEPPDGGAKDPPKEKGAPASGGAGGTA